MDTNSLGLTNSDTIALGAALIAALSLFATFYQAHLSKVSMQKSVLPIINTHLGYLSENRHSFVYSLKNNGLGPAKLKRIDYFAEGKPMNAKSAIGIIDSMVDTFCNSHGLSKELTFFETINDDSFYLSVGREFTLFRISIIDRDAIGTYWIPGLDEILKKKIGIVVEYQDIYGKPFKTDDRHTCK